jgi:hypothetical protein
MSGDHGMTDRALLIALAGLPGTGKTTLAREVCRRIGAVHLRIDTIEQALRAAGMGDVGPAGYTAAYALAEDNLRLGHVVVADSVNPLQVTRDAWRAVAERAQAPVVEVEIVRSDAADHRHHVETRSIDIPGLVPPSWEAVVTRAYDGWTRPRIVVDTSGKTIEQSVEVLLSAIPARPSP